MLEIFLEILGSFQVHISGFSFPMGVTAEAEGLRNVQL